MPRCTSPPPTVLMLSPRRMACWLAFISVLLAALQCWALEGSGGGSAWPGEETVFFGLILLIATVVLDRVGPEPYGHAKVIAAVTLFLDYVWNPF